jgi:hypothetical protein
MPTWSKQLRPVFRAYAFSIAFWIPLSVLVGYQNFMLDMGSRPHVSLWRALLVYGTRYFAVALLTPPLFYIVARWPVSRRHFRRIGVYALGYVPFISAFAIIRWVLLPPWLEETNSFGPRTLETLTWLVYTHYADSLLLFLGILLAAHAYTYFVQSQQQEVDRSRLRQHLAQSELQALRAQLQPHFLFNTLQGVSALIDSSPSTAQTMLLTLASLLRTVLKHGSCDLITVRDELELVRAYLCLEQMRLGTRLAVRWRISPEAEGALIPQLLLQPLVENAIVHGIAPARDGGWIAIEAAVRNTRLFVEIRNSVADSSPPGLHIGLVNVKARLQHLYSDDAAFEFRIEADTNTALARLALPAFATSLAEPAAAFGSS